MQSLESESLKASGLGKLTRQQPVLFGPGNVYQTYLSGQVLSGSVTRGSSFIDFIPGKKKISVNLLIVIVGIIYIIAKIIIQSDRANQL